ncbi:MAG: L,D-transpeptidase family protein [Bradymonadaceae bacterium]|nr:L,D-transpeptidase family protein [Lujinxingiaceae bacterium]
MALCLFGMAACQEPLISAEEAGPFVADWSQTVEPVLLEQASRAATAKALKERLVASAAADKAKVTRDDPPFDVFIDEVYKALEYQPALVDSGKLTARGEQVWATLQAVDSHLLDTKKYPLEPIREKLEELDKKRQSFKSFDGLAPTGEELTYITEHLTKKHVSEFELVAANHAQLTTMLMDSPKGQRLRLALGEYEAMSTRKAGMEVEIEQLLAQGLVRYSREMKHHRLKEIFIHPRNDDFYNEQEIRSRRPDEAKGPYEAGVIWRRAAAIAESMADKPKILHTRMRETLRDALTADTERALAALIPDQPQYMGLVKEYARYKKIVEAGGWQNVTVPRSLNPGDRAEVVVELKKRLLAEGYYPADAALDNRYDDALSKAITAYQETHQMEVTGKPHAIFWRSVNVAADRRAEQIAINIKRWRKSNVRHDLETYAFVNIMDFHVELWKGQERKMRVGVVVGNNELAVNPLTEEKAHSNRTPTPLAAYIDRVIYNPYWNVTPRLRAEDILPKVKESVQKEYAAKLKTLRKRSSPVRAVAREGEEGGASAVDDEPVFTSGATTDGLRFNMQAVRNVKKDAASGAADGELSTEQLRQMFPYLNPETGEVDVSTTDPNHIPKWYAENRYEVAFPGRTWEYVRMIPGPDNALGLVKIIFPNYSDVYLHDTPAKALFSRPVRAFSHGCIRMADPLGVAEWLLRNDGKWEAAKVPTTLKSGDYLPVFLDRQVPVFLEYYTVRVDDAGRANFLADVYSYDSNPS